MSTATERTGDNRRDRALSSIRFLLSSPVRNRTAIEDCARSFFQTALDEEFNVVSPFQQLPPELMAACVNRETVLPPQTWLKGGNQDFAGLLFIVGLARALNSKRVFEIGTYNGVTAWTLARNMGNAEVNTLDIPPGSEPSLPFGVSDHENKKEFTQRAYPLPPGSGVVIQHWGDSATFDFSAWRRSCDLIYVDGAHSRQYVDSDSENAIDMLAPVGAIVWDDYWWRIPGVAESLHDMRTRGGLDGIYRVPKTRLAVHLSEAAMKRLFQPLAQS